MPKHLMEGTCHVCSKSTEYKTDKNGKAYYACGFCGTRMFFGPQPSNALIEQVEEGKQDGIQSGEQEQQPTGTTEATGTVTEREPEPEQPKPAGYLDEIF